MSKAENPPSKFSNKMSKARANREFLTIRCIPTLAANLATTAVSVVQLANETFAPRLRSVRDAQAKLALAEEAQAAFAQKKRAAAEDVARAKSNLEAEQARLARRSNPAGNLSGAFRTTTIFPRSGRSSTHPFPTSLSPESASRTKLSSKTNCSRQPALGTSHRYWLRRCRCRFVSMPV